MSNDTTPLGGRTFLITGASSGIGRATARRIAEAGGKVVICARRMERLNELAGELGGPARCLPVAADVSKSEQIDQLVEKAQAFAGTDGLAGVIVNAGHGLAGGVLESDRRRWEEMYQLNVLGAAHLMRSAAQLMLPRQRGDIVVIGSVVGVHISPFSAFYGSTKFAITAIAEGLRREVARRGVRVSVVKPGIVESEFQEVAGYQADEFGKSAAQYGQWLAPDDIARPIVFILSQPRHVHINDIMIRPTGQDYP